ncbi:MAG: SLC13 family permease [Proteobacteria bacterium]|nr:SLC13 family permease [Pseudomonadota bacterium]MDA1300870.1 SLC13 family permease [Pseudomonadota bacterium]
MDSFPDVPNIHAGIVMVLTVVALYVFSRERLRLEITSLLLLVFLAVLFSVFPYGDFEPTTLFFGFAHEALIAVCALMVLGQGLVHTGALEPVGRTLGYLWGKSPALSFLATLIVGAALSAFINNTPVVVLLLPILISVCLRNKRSSGEVLMPMGFATLVGGMATTIGTSTNLLVVKVAEDLGVPRFGMFDFALPAMFAAIIAILYLWLIAPRLLPNRSTQLDSSSPRLFEAKLHLVEDSVVIGKPLSNAIALTGGDMTQIRLWRDDTAVMPLPDVILRVGDQIRVRDTPANLKRFEEALKAELFGDEHRVDEDHPLSAKNQTVAELAVVQGSELDGTTLSFGRFMNKYQLAVLALHRGGQDIWRREIDNVSLRVGDLLLVQGAHEQVESLKKSPDLLVLDASIALPRTEKATLALVIVVTTVVLAAAGIMPIAIAAITGACVLLLTRCINISTAVKAISPSVYFVVAASLALGLALQETGATVFLTEAFLYLTSGSSPAVVMSALMLLLAILTNVVSNNAAAVIGTPIAIGIARHLGLPAEPFVLAVLFGANMSYATPMAYKTNLLVMSAGNYTFGDFVRVGVPLTIIMWLALTFLLTMIYF